MASKKERKTEFKKYIPTMDKVVENEGMSIYSNGHSYHIVGNDGWLIEGGTITLVGGYLRPNFSNGYEDHEENYMQDIVKKLNDFLKNNNDFKLNQYKKELKNI